MILSDGDLERVWPGVSAQPASIDLHLGDRVLWWPEWVTRDPRADQSDQWRVLPISAGLWTLRPGLRYLAATRERVALPDDLVGLVAARSSWGRDGLAVIQGPAGVVDPGWSGRLTLELSVVGSPLVVWPGARVAQLLVARLETPARRPYRGKYQGDDGVVPSRTHLDGDVPVAAGVAS